MRQQGARSRDQQCSQRILWQMANVRKGCTCDRTFWISTDELQDAQVVVELDNTQECRARIEQEMLDKGDAIKLETTGNQ